MGLTDGVVRNDALRATVDGFELDVRIGWYRSLPLSSVDGVQLKIDGKDVPAAAIRFVLDGQDYALADLPPLWDRWWFVQDPAVLRVSPAPDGPMAAGRSVHVELDFGWRIPYIIIGPQTAFVQRANVVVDLVAGEPAPLTNGVLA